MFIGFFVAATISIYIVPKFFSIIGVLWEIVWKYICRNLKIDKNFVEATSKSYVVIERLLGDRGE